MNDPMNTGWKGAVLLSIAFLWMAGIALADKKVTVCHFPPGNAANPQTISVGEAAVGAHLDHGDRLGECPTGCRLNESLCDDENACTADSCNASGECQNEPVNCDDGNPCTTESCSVSEGCLGVANNGASCDDGVACTNRDACVGSECRGTPIAGCCTTTAQCDDGDACTRDACVGGRCTSEPRDCSVADKCLAGFCDPSSGCRTAPVNCDDTNVCTDDSCDPARGCFSQPTTNPPQSSESLCADGVDNDCDGTVDGADADCAGCAVDTDCRLYDSYCADGTQCTCLVLGPSDPDPICSGTPVQCVAQPCGFGQSAVCLNGTCDIR